MTEPTEREAFESWWSLFTANSDARLAEYQKHAAWVAWWQRASTPPVLPEPVALQSVELTRDTMGMCVVKINGREAIRDNGDVISHYATLDWFAGTPPVLTAEQAERIVAALDESDGGYESIAAFVRALSQSLPPAAP